jgi:hypothetical protein
MYGGVFVNAAEACNEMVLECAYGSLCSIAAMDPWWHKLIGDVLGVHEVFQHGGAFVVKLLKPGLKASFVQ